MRACLTILLLLVATSGCSLGQKRLHDSHLGYNEAISKAQAEELLLNIVRLRYREGVQFLFVDSVAAQYSLEYGADGLFGSDDGSLRATVSPHISYSDRPTITFLPRSDRGFVRKLTAPLEVSLLVSLSSFQPEFARLVQMAAITLNGRFVGSGEDSSLPPETLRTFTGLERSNSISLGFVSERRRLSEPMRASDVGSSVLITAYEHGLRFEPGEKKDTLQLVANVETPSLIVASRDKETDRLLSALGLAPGRSQYTIRAIGNRDVDSTQTILLQTRSVIGMMHHLSRGVEVPGEDLERGVVEEMRPLGGIFRVHASRRKPELPGVAVRHRGRWFSVSGTDTESTRTFALMQAIYQLQLASDEEAGGPLLTLPLN